MFRFQFEWNFYHFLINALVSAATEFFKRALKSSRILLKLKSARDVIVNNL